MDPLHAAVFAAAQQAPSPPFGPRVFQLSYGTCGFDQGWVFYWGTTDWSAQQIWAVANRLNLVRPIIEQPE